MTPICPSRITGAFGAFRNVMVEFPVPWNVTELFTALVCHESLGNTVTIPARNGSGMLGATIYDEIIIYIYIYIYLFIYTQS